MITDRLGRKIDLHDKVVIASPVGAMLDGEVVLIETTSVLLQQKQQPVKRVVVAIHVLLEFPLQQMAAPQLVLVEKFAGEGKPGEVPKEPAPEEQARPKLVITGE